MDAVLEKIKDFADRAHGEQKRKYTPERYIVHPVRVMELCRQYLPTLPVLAAALLHDVLEDTPVTKDEMDAFLRTVMNEEDAAQTLALVLDLTDIYTKQAYPHWNRKKRKARESERIENSHPDAQTIKYADIIDNCKEIVGHDPDFAVVFLRECRSLLKRIAKGNASLYRQAQETVNYSLEQIPRRQRNPDS